MSCHYSVDSHKDAPMTPDLVNTGLSYTLYEVYKEHLTLLNTYTYDFIEISVFISLVLPFPFFRFLSVQMCLHIR